MTLLEFLRTGEFAPLHRGMSRQAVELALGPPDDLGGQSRKYPRPRVYRYRDLEIHFSAEGESAAVYLEAAEESTEFRLPDALEVQGWDLRPGQTIATVLDYLTDHRLRTRLDRGAHGARLQVDVSSVRLSFNEDERLWSIGAELQ